MISLARPRGRIALVIAAGACLSALSCGAVTDRPDANVRVDTLETGTIIVRNTPAALDAPPVGWEPREILRIGDPLDGPAAFGRVAAVEVDDAGAVYVLDAQATEVRVFGSDGEHVRNVGGSGGGPGEFTRPSGLVLAPDGRLWVLDGFARRYVTFTLGGEAAGSYQRRIGGADPVVVGQGSSFAFYESGLLPSGAGQTARIFLGQRPGDGVMLPFDTVIAPSELVPPTWEIRSVEVRPGMMEGGSVDVPFSPESRFGIDPRGGFWWGRTDSLRFTHLSFGGDTIRVVERGGARAQPVATADLDRALADLRERWGDRLRVDRELLPERMPHWDALLVDGSNRLWVRRFRPPAEAPAPPAMWVVYDPEGAYLGAIELPFATDPLPVVRNGRVAGVVRDEFDLDYVVVYELY